MYVQSHVHILRFTLTIGLSVNSWEPWKAIRRMLVEARKRTDQKTVTHDAPHMLQAPAEIESRGD